MIVLTTGNPSAKVEGEQIAIRFPSGKHSLTVALDVHQAFALEQCVRTVTCQAIQERRNRPVPACAQIIAFKARTAA